MAQRIDIEASMAEGSEKYVVPGQDQHRHDSDEGGDEKRIAELLYPAHRSEPEDPDTMTI